MNRGNFTAKDAFPVSTQTYDFIQQMAILASKAFSLGGSNYILSGCAIAGNQVSEGLIVINGEILPFEAGELSEKITIQEVRESDNAFGIDYPEAYIHRAAKFSVDGEYLWNDFVRVLTNLELQNKINAITGDVPGITKGWAGLESKIPKDYMLCDGRSLSKEEYPELFESIGYSYGGDGFDSFMIPNHKRRFAVGYDSSHEEYKMGKTGGEEKQTLTENNLPEHDHTNNSTFNKLSARAADVNDLGTPSGIDSDAADKEYNVGNMTNAYWVQATIQKVGKGIPFDNRPPFIVEARIIKVK